MATTRCIDRKPNLNMNLTQHESCLGRLYPEPVKRQASKGQRSTIQRLRGFTLVELLVVISIIGLLAAMLLPALNKAKEKALAVNCSSNHKQIMLATQLYCNDFEDVMVPLFYIRASPSFTNLQAANPYDTNVFIVYNSGIFSWPDLFRIGGYMKQATAYSCPMLLSQKTSMAGASGISNAKYPLGIGINWPEIGVIFGSTAPSFKLTSVKNISETVFFADSGAESGWGGSGATTNYDDWVDYKANTGGVGYANIFWRDKVSIWSGADALSIPRHGKRVNTAWGDGHVEIVKNSVIWDGNFGSDIAKWDNP